MANIGNKPLKNVYQQLLQISSSGEIADLMSEMMREMSLNRQIISVTHLPQIASKANHHFKVYKKEK